MQQDTSPLVKSHNGDTSSDDGLNLRVRCSGSVTYRGSPLKSEYEIRVPKTGCSVQALKELVRNVIGSSANGRYLRLISSGKMLAPDNAKVESFDLKDGDCVHAVLAAAGVRGGVQAAMARGERATLEASSDESSDDDLEIGANSRRGFDRLRITGLSRSEISAVRLYFAPRVNEYIESRPPNSETDRLRESNPTAFHYQMEEEWMATQGPTSEFRLNLSTGANNMVATTFRGMQFEDGVIPERVQGTDRDFLFGFLMGFFVGPICMLWVWMPTVSNKQKIGILSGISFKLVARAFTVDVEEVTVVQT